MRDPAAQSDSDTGRIEVKNTTCYMCACRCGIRVTLRDGEVRYIEGNPDHPLNKGVICAKGSSGIMKQYSPARLTRPLLRKAGSDRGDRTVDAEAVDFAGERRRKGLVQILLRDALHGCDAVTDRHSRCKRR